MKPKINTERLWSRMMRMAEIGATEKGGSNRVALTPEDKQGRDLFVQWCKELGCKIQIDNMGNIFAIRPGQDNSLLPISCGSHLDTQPRGGKFDGVYGVLAGVEIFECLNENDIQTRAPLQICVWTNEEGARFPPPMLSSGVYAGSYELDYAYNRVDADGIRLEDALKGIGYDGPIACGSNKMGAFLEVHIEQGPILEAEKKVIGVVTKAQGARWYRIHFNGQDAHTGTTPMPARKDSLLAASHAIVEIEKIALRHGPDAVATVGRIENEPNSHNTIAGNTTITVDMRNPSEEVLDQMQHELHSAAQQAASATRCEAEVEIISNTPAVHFDERCLELIEQNTQELGLSYKKMISGAGHDACHLAKVTPTAMIFIPCEEGISHNESEYAAPEDLANGAQVLLGALLDLAQPVSV